MRLISHCLTPVNQLSGILSLIGFSNLSTPSPFSALPPVIFHEASPKAISERTSYLQVRLEFHRYPQLIPAIFNLRGFGPPVRFTTPSAWSWVGHLVSGLRHLTFRPIKTRFRSGSVFSDLTSLDNVTRRFILQKARHCTLMCFDYL